MTATTPHSVLVVEDEWIVAEDVIRHLQSAGYTVAAAARTAEEAVRRVVDERPSLVLIDIGLAGEADGIKAAAELRKRAPLVPVVFLTGHHDPATLARATALRPAGFVVKPYQPAQLVSAVAIGIAQGSSLRDEAQIRGSLADTLRHVADTLEPEATHLGSSPVRTVDQVRLPSLTGRERDIARLLATGMRLRRVAETLGISYHTARNHLKRVFAKAGVNSQLALVRVLRRSDIDLAAADRPSHARHATAGSDRLP